MSAADRIVETLPACSVLEKPFHPKQFMAKLGEVLSKV
jgi:hypothetical protein